MSLTELEKELTKAKTALNNVRGETQHESRTCEGGGNTVRASQSLLEILILTSFQPRHAELMQITTTKMTANSF